MAIHTVPSQKPSPSNQETPVGGQERVSPQKPKRHRGLSLLIELALLIILVTLGGDFEGLTPAGTTSQENIITVTGPFIHSPLDGAQVNAIMHLVGHMKYKMLAKLYVSHMTLDEELGQLFMAQSYDTYYSPALDMMVNKLHVGGIVMYAFQMQTFKQTKHDIAQMQLHTSLPLLIATDEEGGFVERVQNIYGDRPGALQTYETGDPNKAAQLGHQITHDLRALGINEDLAPDTDVQLVDGPDQYLRTWGYTAQSVITFAGAYMQAVQGDGLVACIKHYPGLGAATTDAHFSLPVIKRTSDQIYSVELAPFKAFIQSPNRLLNPGMIMSTDLSMPAIDPVWPAELSHIFMTDILRNEFGYDGVVITDALWMTGIAKHWNLRQAAVLALNAGNDMLLGAIGPYQLMDLINALKEALQNGTLSKARVDEAATRIITLKLEYHIMPDIPPQ